MPTKSSRDKLRDRQEAMRSTLREVSGLRVLDEDAKRVIEGLAKRGYYISKNSLANIWKEKNDAKA